MTRIERTFLLFVPAVLALAAVGCEQAKHDGPSARAVKAYTVAAPRDIQGVRYSASIRPHREVRLAWKCSGYVTEVNQRRGIDGDLRDVQQGDEIARGALLAKVEDKDQQESLNRARAQEVEAIATFERCRLDQDRAEKLYQSKSLTRPEYDATRAAFLGAQARVDAATASRRAAEKVVVDCALVSPLDGVVLSREVEIGTLASPGAVAFSLADLSKLEAVFGVPEREIRELKVGDLLEVRVEDRPPIRAQITALSPSANSESRVFEVEVAIPNANRELRTGMIATVLVDEQKGVRTPSTGLSVPLAAVVRPSAKSGAYAVFTLEGDGDRAVARQRNVELGPLAGNDVMVESGLNAGERVVVAGATLVQDGEAVRILP